MATTYTEVYDGFLKMIEKDKQFFNFLGDTDAFAQSIIKTRCHSLMEEACSRIMFETSPEVNFAARDDENEYFLFDMTPQEKYLVASLMNERYLARDIAYLKNISVNYAPTDVRVFDPSNWRSTFLSFYETVCAENRRLLEEYRCHDRSTGALVGIDYTEWNIDEV